MSEHALITAATELQLDENRRKRRGQKTRLSGGQLLQIVGAKLAVHSATTPAGVEDSNGRRGRGRLAVDVFGYVDTFDESAATVITDILHAVAQAGYSPQAVLNQAAAYYADEQETPQDAYALTR